MPEMDEPLHPEPLSDGEPETVWRHECRFVPVRATDLARLLVGDAERFFSDAEGLGGALDEIREVIEQEASQFQRELEEAYAAFNPDRETLIIAQPTGAEEPAYGALHDRLAYLLDKANYERLDDIRIAQVVERANSGRIQVRIHPDRVERLELWVRGQGETCKKRRTLRCPIKGVEYSQPVFKRMAVIAQLKDDPNVLIKLFKDIPEAEVEALLPHAEAAMTLLDRVKLFGASAGAAGAMALKLAKVALALAMLSKILWIVLVGVGTIALRTFFGYKNAKTSRNWRRTQRLYFQNLGNNASALQLLIASVKQEELKEAYLCYAFLLGAEKGTLSKSDLRRSIEVYLQEKLEAEVDFDIDDAMETITRLGLWKEGAERQVCSPTEAVAVMQKHSREQRTANYHLML